MLNSGMPNLSCEDVQYVHDALLPGATETEATSAFTRSVTCDITCSYECIVTCNITCSYECIVTCDITCSYECIVTFKYLYRCIETSLGSKATQINFIIHSLAQMKFSSDSNLSNGLLSFCPTSYS